MRENEPRVDLRKLSPLDLQLEIIKMKSVAKIYLNEKKPELKQILHNVTGYARPGEMVAIMGASGSGKTSLLNILGERLDVSSQAEVSRDVKVNGQ